jgi:GH24 family phage-related lysozyme (muramidase)
MADPHRVLHHLDILKCNHGGLVDLYNKVLDRKSEIHQDLRVVTDDDLYHHCPIVGCSIGCKKIVSIQEGLSLQYELTGGTIPIVSNLSATTDKGCTVKVDDSLAAALAHEEGKSNKKYIDSKGHPTVGIGFNLDRSGAANALKAQGLDYNAVRNGTQSLTDDQVNNLFAQDQANAESGVQNFVSNWSSLDANQQTALTDLYFNMGDYSSRFPNMVRAVNAGDMDKAAQELGSNGRGGPSGYVNDVGAERSGRQIARLRGNEPYAMPQ